MLTTNADGAERQTAKIFTAEYTVTRFESGNYGIILMGWFPSSYILEDIGTCKKEWPTPRAREAMNRFARRRIQST